MDKFLQEKLMPIAIKLGNNKGLECSSPHTGGFLSITGLIMGRAVIRAGSAPCGHSSSVPLGRDSFHSAF